MSRLDRLGHPSAAASLFALAALGGAAPAHAQTVYVAFGDSITEGVGDDVPEGPDAGYPIRLEQLLPDAEVRNRGSSGETTPEGVTRIDQVLLEGGDVLLLMEGTNDISQGISQEATLFNLERMAVKAASLGIETVHATLIPRLPNARSDPDNLRNQELNQELRDLAGRANRRLVDNFEVYSEQANLFNTFYWTGSNDPVGHPNAAGYDLMAETFADVLQGIDSVPPVPGIISPNNGHSGVPANAAIEVDIWDFGAGIDLQSIELLVDGAVVQAPVLGSSRHASVSFTPPGGLSGLVRVALRAGDLAVPTNRFDREIARFTAAGTGFIEGDLDQSGRVDGVDLVRLGLAFGSSRGQRRYDARADLDGDGVVNGADLARLAANFGESL